MADLIETARAAGSYTIWLALLDAAGLTARMRGPGPFTLFAAADETLASLPPASLATLQADPDMLRMLLAYQIVPGRYVAADLMAGLTLTTLSGKSLRVTVDAGLQVDGIYLRQADLLADNGVIHTTDGVLHPA